MMLRPRIIAQLVALAIVTAHGVAYAQPAPDAPPAESRPGYTLEVDSDAPEVISFDGIAARVSSELGAEVTRPGTPPPSRAAIVVRYREGDRALTVRAVHPNGRVLERSVRAEGDAAAVQREAVLLAGNLARDEAAELLDALSARAPKELPKPPPAPAPAPAPSPAPSPVDPSRPPPRTDGEVIASAALVYPVATNIGQPHVASWLDVSLVYGRVGGVRALQLGGGGVYASEYVHGAQISTMLAVTRDLRGVQISAVNVARNVEGVQLSLVNVARRVKGAQLAVVNVAEEVDGAAIGLVSITKNGVHPLVWTSNLAIGNLGVKFATKYSYVLLATQYGTLETGLKPRFGAVAGLGLHLPIASSFDLEAEGALTHIGTESLGSRASNSWVHARILAGWSFASHLRVFGGGGVRTPFLDVDLGRTVVRPEFVGGVQF